MQANTRLRLFILDRINYSLHRTAMCPPSQLYSNAVFCKISVETVSVWNCCGREMWANSSTTAMWCENVQNVTIAEAKRCLF